MKIAIIGRTQILFETMFMLKKAGYDISCILTSKEAPEYTKVSDDFKQIAKDWNIPFAKGAKILEHTEFLSSSNSDIALSLNYNGMIPILLKAVQELSSNVNELQQKIEELEK